MIDWVAFWKYFGVVSALLASGFGAPIPEELPIVTAGAMVGHDSRDAAPDAAGLTKWYIMLPLIILGVVTGDCVLYFAGRLFGRQLLASRFVARRILPPEKREKIEQNFHARGVMILLAARFTPGIRSPVFIMSGVLKMPFRQFVLADGLYAIPGVNIMFWLSYVFTDQFVAAVENVEDKVQRNRPVVVVAIVAAALGILLYRFLTTRTLATGDLSSIPVYAKPVTAVASRVEAAVELTIDKTVETTKGVLDKVTHPRGPGDKVLIPPAPGVPADPGIPVEVPAEPEPPKPV